MLISRTARPAARDQHGFTLIETLVAVLTGVIITGALFAILEVSLRQTARVTDFAHATQLGRTTMTRIVDELHSACLAPGFTPVQEGSKEDELIVVNAYSEKAELPITGGSGAGPTAAGARKDKIVWNKEAKTLTDFTYPSTEGAWPKFTFASTASPAGGTRIGEGVSQTENSKAEALPVFQYYSYATKSSSGPATPSSTLNESAPLTGTLKAKEAEAAASVLINFRTAPTNGNSKIQAGRSADFSNQVTFAFSAPNAESTIEDAPCK